VDAFLNAVMSGIIIGSLYATMAVGLTVVYGVSHVFNFAHGHVAVFGAYVTWLLIVDYGVGLGVGVIGMAVLLPIFGWLLYQLTIKSLLRRSQWVFGTLLFTLGLAILMEYGLLEFFGPRVKSIPVFASGSVRLWFGVLAWHDVVVIVLSIALIVLLRIFLAKTTFGQAMRAVATSVPGARIVGMDIDRVFGATFALAFLITGFSGVLLGTKSYMTPHIGWEWMIKGFIIVTFGGLGNVMGAIVAAFALGVIESLVTLYAGAIWIWPAWLIVFIVALSVRPQGILGGRAA
jgi:branched-chain amino acid transport system permease protein